MINYIRQRKKKGFTLVELLVVVVLLSVVVLIATTNVISSIKKAQKRAFLNSAEQYLKAVKNEVIAYDEGEQLPDSIYRFPDYKFVTLTQQPDAGYIIVDDEGNYRVSIWSDKLKLCAFKDYNDDRIEISTTIKKKSTCTSVYPDEDISEDDLGPNQYQIAFHANGGKKPSDNSVLFIQVFNYGEDGTIQLNPFVKDKYDFVGWNTFQSASGDATFIDGAVINKPNNSTKTYHLYAQWKPSSSILLAGSDFNGKIKTIANNSTLQWYSTDNKIEGFEKSSTAPSDAIKNVDHELTIENTRYPVYAWFDENDNKIKWWSESLDIRLNPSSANLFRGMTQLKSASLVGFNAEDATNFEYMFYNDTNLLSFDFTGINTKSLTKTSSMFENCQKITSIDLSMMNTEKVTNMEAMFKNTKKLESVNLTGWNTRKVENMVSLFNSSETIETIDLSSFYDDELTNMASMFSGCKKLKTVLMPHFTTKKVSNMFAIFKGCTSIEHIDMSKFNSDNLTMINQGFQGDTNLKTIDLSSFVLSKETTFQYAFNACPSLTTIYVSSNFDSSKVKNDLEVFKGATSLRGGGAGNTALVYDANKVSSEYARIDDPEHNLPGYFSVKSN